MSGPDSVIWKFYVGGGSKGAQLGWVSGEVGGRVGGWWWVEGCWLGGDITLAVMSNVFIGNPASTFSTFIAKSRLALGFGHNELYRAKDPDGKWRTVCGDHCIFDTGIMPHHA